MFEFHKKVNTEIPSEKSFGIVFSTVFFLIGIYPIVNGNSFRMWAIVLSLIFIGLVYFLPKIFTIPNKLWFKFGILLGGIIAPVVIALVYFVTVVPIGLIMKLLKKDLLHQRIDKKVESYWVERIQPVGSMKNQF